MRELSVHELEYVSGGEIVVVTGTRPGGGVWTIDTGVPGGSFAGDVDGEAIVDIGAQVDITPEDLFNVFGYVARNRNDVVLGKMLKSVPAGEIATGPWLPGYISQSFRFAEANVFAVSNVTATGGLGEVVSIFMFFDNGEEWQLHDDGQWRRAT